jgi:plasmid maintenance system antidote protein VapI
MNINDTRAELIKEKIKSRWPTRPYNLNQMATSCKVSRAAIVRVIEGQSVSRRLQLKICRFVGITFEHLWVNFDPDNFNTH